MEDFEKWGIMTDWRYSYLTMMPDYEAYVIEQFGQLLKGAANRRVGENDLIFRGSRAVFWSVDQQRIMDEHQVEEYQELRDCAVVKFPILSYTDNEEGTKRLRPGGLQKISDLYDNVKMVVFCEEPWRLLGAHALAINDKLQYALVKCTYNNKESSEYLIMAEKRIAEFQARATYTTKRQQHMELKTLLLMQGEQLEGIVTSHPLLARKTLPTVVYGGVTSTFGTGVLAVTPGHDLESLKIAVAYPHLEKSGVLDE
jgi:isoleucyl-tRNA synthetase